MKFKIGDKVTYTVTHNYRGGVLDRRTPYFGEVKKIGENDDGVLGSWIELTAPSGRKEVRFFADDNEKVRHRETVTA